MIEIPSLLTPSYAQGFARNRAEAANPNLWDGLVGLWQPTLGPTGLTLFDQSGYRRNGTLTNMELDTDWMMTPEGWVLDFGGTDEHVVLDSTLTFTVPYSLMVWFRSLDAGLGYQSLIGGTSNGMYVNWEYPTRLYLNCGTTYNVIVGPACDGNWHCGVIYVSMDATGNGADVDMFFDGLYKGVSTHDYNGSNFTLGYVGRFGTYYGIASLRSAAGWRRHLTASEIQQLYIDPHSLVRPKQRVLFASAGGAPPAPPYWMWARQQQAQVIGGGVL